MFALHKFNNIKEEASQIIKQMDAACSRSTNITLKTMDKDYNEVKY